MNSKNKQQGFIVLISVIVMCAIGTTLASSLILLGLAYGQSNRSFGRYVQTGFLASSCAEYALENLQENDEYSGNENLILSSGQCHIFSVDNSNSTFTIRVEGTTEEIARRIIIKAKRLNTPSAGMMVISWQEVPNF